MRDQFERTVNKHIETFTSHTEASLALTLVCLANLELKCIQAPHTRIGLIHCSMWTYHTNIFDFFFFAYLFALIFVAFMAWLFSR